MLGIIYVVGASFSVDLRSISTEYSEFFESIIQQQALSFHKHVFTSVCMQLIQQKQEGKH